MTNDPPIEDLSQLGKDSQMQRYSCRTLQASEDGITNLVSFTLYVGLLCPPHRVSKALSAVILRLKIRLKPTHLSPMGKAILSLRAVLCDLLK